MFGTGIPEPPVANQIEASEIFEEKTTNVILEVELDEVLKIETVLIVLSDYDGKVKD